MNYIRLYYGVPAKRGAQVKYNGRIGTIKGSKNGRLLIRLDGEKNIMQYHPTWNIEYL